MSKERAINNLKHMLGNEYLYMGIQYTFINYADRGDKIEISTNKGWITKKNDELMDFLLECTQVNGKEVMPVQSMPILEAASTDTIAFLKNTLIDNINKVKEDKNYIGQATQINKDVHTIIELAKTEIEMVKLVKGVK